MYLNLIFIYIFNVIFIFVKDNNCSFLRIYNIRVETLQLKYLLILQIKNIIRLAYTWLSAQCIYCIKQSNFWTMYLTNFVVLKI